MRPEDCLDLSDLDLSAGGGGPVPPWEPDPDDEDEEEDEGPDPPPAVDLGRERRLLEECRNVATVQEALEHAGLSRVRIVEE
jgi:hypothetical protein